MRVFLEVEQAEHREHFYLDKIVEPGGGVPVLAKPRLPGRLLFLKNRGVKGPKRGFRGGLESGFKPGLSGVFHPPDRGPYVPGDSPLLAEGGRGVHNPFI